MTGLVFDGKLPNECHEEMGVEIDGNGIWLRVSDEGNKVTDSIPLTHAEFDALVEWVTKYREAGKLFHATGGDHEAG